MKTLPTSFDQPNIRLKRKLVLNGDMEFTEGGGGILSIGDLKLTSGFFDVQVSLIDIDGTLETWVRNQWPYGTTAVLSVINEDADELELVTGYVRSPVSFSNGQLTCTISTAKQSKGLLSVVSDTVAGTYYSVHIPKGYGKPLRVPAAKAVPPNITELMQQLTYTSTTIAIRKPAITPTGTFDFFSKGIMFRGTYSESTGTPTITLTEKNVERTATVSAASTDSSIVYCATNLQDMFVKYGSTVNYCVYQEGTKCYFLNNWPSNVPNGATLAYAASTRTSWGVTMQLPAGSGAVITRHGFNADGYHILAGTKINLANAPSYAFNDAASTVLEVMAERDGVLSAVPSHYWTYAFNGTYASIDFTEPLSTRDEGWSDNIYVSFDSSRSTGIGSCIADAISLVGVSTLNAAAYDTSQAAYPVNFCITQQVDVISFVKSVAQQSRTYINPVAGGIKLVSMCAEPTNNVDDNIVAGTIGESFTDELSTSSTYLASWSIDGYAQEQPLTYTLDGNMGTESLDVIIYNAQSLVWKTLAYYAYQGTRLWRTRSFVLPMSGLKYEPGDLINGALVQEVSIGLGTVSVSALVVSSAWYTGNGAISTSDTAPNDPSAGRSPIDYTLSKVPVIPGGNTAKSAPTFSWEQIPALVSNNVPFALAIRVFNGSDLSSVYDGDYTISVEGDVTPSLSSTTLTILNGKCDGQLALSVTNVTQGTCRLVITNSNYTFTSPGIRFDPRYGIQPMFSGSLTSGPLTESGVNWTGKATGTISTVPSGATPTNSVTLPTGVGRGVMYSQFAPTTAIDCFVIVDAGSGASNGLVAGDTFTSTSVFNISNGSNAYPAIRAGV